MKIIKITLEVLIRRTMILNKSNNIEKEVLILVES
jgi:hypothetical protein